MLFFWREERDLINKKCIGCVCATCKNLENEECKFKYNECRKETNTCKMITCSEYKK